MGRIGNIEHWTDMKSKSITIGLLINKLLASNMSDGKIKYWSLNVSEISVIGAW